MTTEPIIIADADVFDAPCETMILDIDTFNAPMTQLMTKSLPYASAKCIIPVFAPINRRMSGRNALHTRAMRAANITEVITETEAT